MSGTGITGGGSGYAAILAHAGVLYGTELGSVTLKRVGFFCFPIKHSTHTPLTIMIPASGLRSTHGIFSFCYLFLVHPLLLLFLFSPGKPRGIPGAFPSLQHPSSPTGLDCVLVMRYSKGSRRFSGIWGSWGGPPLLLQAMPG